MLPFVLLSSVILITFNSELISIIICFVISPWRHCQKLLFDSSNAKQAVETNKEFSFAYNLLLNLIIEFQIRANLFTYFNLWTKRKWPKRALSPRVGKWKVTARVFVQIPYRHFPRVTERNTATVFYLHCFNREPSRFHILTMNITICFMGKGQKMQATIYTIRKYRGTQSNTLYKTWYNFINHSIRLDIIKI